MFNTCHDVNAPDSFGDVTECVDCSSPDGLLVRLEQFQQLKADPHPLSSRHILGSSVCDTSHQVYAVLLYLQHNHGLALLFYQPINNLYL